MEVHILAVDRIVEDADQPRRNLDDDGLAGLADSLRRHGLLQPITVAPLHNVGMYRIVTGERRWRAAKLAGLTEVPCLVRELEPDDVLLQQVTENMQREDLQPIERAKAIAVIQERTGATTREVAGMLGLSERMVGNLLDLLELPAEIGAQVVASPNRPADGRLTEKHARYIKQLADEPDLQSRVAGRVRDARLSSAETASLVRALRDSPEDVEEILNAPPEAFSGYLRGKDEAAARRAAEHELARAASAVAIVQSCMATLDGVRPVGMAEADLAALKQALSSLRMVVDALARASVISNSTQS